MSFSFHNKLNIIIKAEIPKEIREKGIIITWLMIVDRLRIVKRYGQLKEYLTQKLRLSCGIKRKTLKH